MKTKVQSVMEWAVLSVCSVLFVTLVLIIVSYLQRVPDTLISYDDYLLQPAETLTKGAVITITAPHTVSLGDAVGISTVHQELTVWENGTLIYECKKESGNVFGKSAASQWHIIPLNPDLSEAMLTFQLSSPYAHIADYRNILFIGESTEIVEYIVVRSTPAIVISMFCVAAGLFAILLPFFKDVGQLSKMLLPAGIGMILLGIWIFSESQRIFFHLIPFEIERQIALFSLTMLPIFLFLTVSELYHGYAKRILFSLVILAISNTVLVVTLQLFQLADLIETIFTTIIILTLGLGLLLFFKIKKMRQQKTKKSRRFFGHLLVIILLSCLEIRAFWIEDFNNTSTYVQILVFTFAILSFFNYLGRNTKRERELKRVRKNLQISRINLFAVSMKPHLISNTLLSIQELCYNAPLEAVKAIGAFSNYLHTSFDIASTENLIPFSQELKYIRAYIDVQKICFREDLVYEEELNTLNFVVPPLTIQPLVENAIKHGVRKRTGKGTVKLKTRMVGGDVFIEVQDDGVGFEVKTKPSMTKPSKKDGYRSSGGNVAYRLRLLCKGRVTVQSVLQQGTVVTVHLPEEGQSKEGI